MRLCDISVFGNAIALMRFARESSSSDFRNAPTEQGAMLGTRSSSNISGSPQTEMARFSPSQETLHLSAYKYELQPCDLSSANFLQVLKAFLVCLDGPVQPLEHGTVPDGTAGTAPHLLGAIR